MGSRVASSLGMFVRTYGHRVRGADDALGAKLDALDRSRVKVVSAEVS